MPVLNDIRRSVQARTYLYSKHAVDQSVIRNITPAEIEEAILGDSEIIEHYPSDKYGPSCLVLGFTKKGRPLHLQCGYGDPSSIKIITLYQPDPMLWTNYRARRTDRNAEQ